MPASTRAVNPHGFTIVFEEEPHVYHSRIGMVNAHGSYVPNPNGREVDYLSGTSFVKRFTPQFDPNGTITERKARERGCSVEQLKFEWMQKANDACSMGTRVHETCEDTLYQRALRNSPQGVHERLLMNAGIAAARHIMSKWRILGVEQLIGDEFALLAGSIDLLALDEQSQTYWILDWKTNTEIRFENPFGGSSQFMLPPVAHLMNCDGVHYELQLATYEMILRSAGYVPRTAKIRRAVIHLTDDGPVFHELADRSVEVRDMLIALLSTPF